MLPDKYQLDQEMSGTTFRELAKLAGFEKDLQIDTLALAQFCEVSEATIKRWIKHQTPTKPMIKLLKLKVLLINKDEIIKRFDEKHKKYEFIEFLLQGLNEQKIKAVLQYSDIKKLALKMIINSLIKLYNAINK